MFVSALAPCNWIVGALVVFATGRGECGIPRKVSEREQTGT